MGVVTIAGASRWQRQVTLSISFFIQTLEKFAQLADILSKWKLHFFGIGQG